MKGREEGTGGGNGRNCGIHRRLPTFHLRISSAAFVSCSKFSFPPPVFLLPLLLPPCLGFHIPLHHSYFPSSPLTFSHSPSIQSPFQTTSLHPSSFLPSSLSLPSSIFAPSSFPSPPPSQPLPSCKSTPEVREGGMEKREKHSLQRKK